MAHYPDSSVPAPLSASDGDVEQALLQQLQAWTPPTPRWADSALHARIAAHGSRPARDDAPLTRWQRVRRRLDLVGWALDRPIPGFGLMIDDPSDPRVALYNQIMGGSNRYQGPPAVLLRYVYLRA